MTYSCHGSDNSSMMAVVRPVVGSAGAAAFQLHAS
jgi:hypothetical protein